MENRKEMYSLRELYRIGRGPSSSHTIGPEKICKTLIERHKDFDKAEVILYGSLAKTGKGHGTDAVIRKTFAPVPCEIIFDCETDDIKHPNTMDISLFKNGNVIKKARAYSVGGGSVEFEGEENKKATSTYRLSKFCDIAEYCKEKKIRLCDFADQYEDDGFDAYMMKIWSAMKESVENGLTKEGILPGGLGVKRKAKQLIGMQHIDESAETRQNRLICAYAFAVSEENASGETIVTAPTCGSAGVVPAVLYYMQKTRAYSDEEIVKALKTAGIFGNVIKTNASISGAECGCQAEVGSACAMAAAALGELFELDIDKIEYAAEIAIEHHLGLTCDPVMGLVQIPCIERNAVAAMRALNAVNLASFLWDSRKISFDMVVETMKETGKDLSCRYRETSEGGLASLYKK